MRSKNKTRLEQLREHFRSRREDLQRIFNTDPEELEGLLDSNPNWLTIYLGGCATVFVLWGIVELFRMAS